MQSHSALVVRDDLPIQQHQGHQDVQSPTSGSTKQKIYTSKSFNVDFTKALFSYCIHISTTTHSHTVAWTFVAIIVQAGWGLYTVVLRYLAFKAPNPVPPLRIMFYYYLLGSLSLLLLYTIPSAILRCLSGSFQPAHGFRSIGPLYTGPSNTPRDVEGSRPSAKGEGTYTGSNRSHDGRHMHRASAKVSFWRGPTLAGIAIGCCLALQVVATVFAARKMKAYWVQSVLTMSPLFVAAVNVWVIHAPLPTHFWRATVLILGGSMLMTWGDGMGSLESEDAPVDGGSGGMSATGMALAILSTCAFAAFTVLVQQTRGLLSQHSIMWWNAMTCLLVSGALSWFTDDTPWDDIERFGPSEWTAMIFLGVVLAFGANLLQQIAIREIGAPLLSALTAVRLVAAAIGSHMMMAEPVRSSGEGAGMVLVVLAVILLVTHQLRKSSMGGVGSGVDPPAKALKRQGM